MGQGPVRPTLLVSYRYPEGKATGLEPEGDLGISNRRAGVAEKSPRRPRFAPGHASVTAEAVVWSQLEKADSSFAEVQNWSQQSLPLRQRQKVAEMLRSLI